MHNNLVQLNSVFVFYFYEVHPALNIPQIKHSLTVFIFTCGNTDLPAIDRKYTDVLHYFF